MKYAQSNNNSVVQLEEKDFAQFNYCIMASKVFGRRMPSSIHALWSRRCSKFLEAPATHFATVVCSRFVVQLRVKNK